VRTTPETFDRITLFKIAAFAETDPRTVADFLAGRRKTVHQNAQAIRRALRTLGIPDPHAAVSR